MSLRNDIMRFSVLGFRSDIRIELQAPVVKHTIKITTIYSAGQSVYSIDKTVAWRACVRMCVRAQEREREKESFLT